MKNFKKIFLILVFLLLVSCSKQKEFTLTSQDIVVFGEELLPIELNGLAISDLEITSSDESVAYVEDGKIVATFMGEAVLTIKYLEKIEYLNVLVLPKLSLNKSMEYGESQELIIENTDYSLDKFLITIDGDSLAIKDGMIEAKNVGSSIVNITYKENEKLQVSEKIDVSPIKPILKADSYEIGIDEFVEFNVENYESNDIFNFYSSNPDVLMIEDGNFGYSLKAGKVIITCKLKSDEKVFSEIEIIVKNPEIKYTLSNYKILVGDTFNIDLYNYPGDDYFKIEISDEAVFQKIGEKTYKALKEGVSKFKATYKEDESISIEIEITVYDKKPIIQVYSNVIFVGDSTKINIINYSDLSKFDFSFSDLSLIDFENNIVTAKKTGVLVVTVTSKEDSTLSSKMNIEILPTQPDVLLTSSYIAVGQKTRLIIKNIDELETKDLSKFDVEYDSNIVSCKDMVFTALEEGKTIIKITSKENKLISGKIELEIADLNKASQNVDENKDPINKKLIMIGENQENLIHAGDFFQFNIVGFKNNEDYKWISSDSTVATVNDTGRVIGVSQGNAQITAISKTNQEARINMYVSVYGLPNVDYAARLVKIATEEIGYREGANNDTKYGAWYNLNYEPWCAMFVSWCANQAGIGTDIIPRYCGCTAGRKWFIDKGLYEARGNGYLPKAGDVIFFRDTSEILDISTHTGIVYACDGKKVYTIEGNTSDMCNKRSYLLTSNYILGYGTPNYPSFDGEPATFAPGNPESGENTSTQ